MNKLKILILVVGLTFAQLSLAQRHEIISGRIASLQVVAGDDWLSPPVITLRGNTPINIDFDDLTHEYHRYVYKVEHCEADWTTSEDLFVSDFIDGFNDGRALEDLEESLNTNVLYTHYHLQIPNAECRLKMSGNYRVTIYDENNDNEEMLKVYFMVVEPKMGISMKVLTNTDIDINGAHHQLDVDLDFGGFLVSNHERQIKTVIMQNGRWDNAVLNPKPQYVRGDGLRWDHNKDLIFPAGNEYRKFEMLDMNHTTMGMEMLDWDGDSYHAYIWLDEPRNSYVYDEDANGSFIIRNTDYTEINRTCDYLLTHFRLKSPRLDGDIYLNGTWTNDMFSEQYQMEYNEDEQIYEGIVSLKQGYYSYQYVWLKPDGTTAPVPSEGSFYQTENKYQMLVYYRGVGERTDQLVGYQQVSNK